jgi:hypothetical protein
MIVGPDVSGRARRSCQIPTTTTFGEVAALAARIRCQIPPTTTSDKEIPSSDRRNRQVRRHDVPTNASTSPKASLVDMWQGIPHESACSITPQRQNPGAVR